MAEQPGHNDKKESHWIESPAEKVILEFPDLIATIGPRHPRWEDRVKLEIKNLTNLIRYLESKNTLPWFVLTPSKTANKVKYTIWNGFLRVPSRPDVKFDIRVFLSPEYPKVFPRAFVDKKIIPYALGNLYIKNEWQEGNQMFIMICHDHMQEQGAWSDNLSIAHFFVREIWTWWNSKQNTILRQWDSIGPTK